jgi:hypothetical protein
VITGVRALPPPVLAPPPPEPKLPPPPHDDPYEENTPNCLSLDLYEEDEDAVYFVFQILDRTFEPPHEAYLVAWHDDNHVFVGTWEWRWKLLSPGDPNTLAAVKWMNTWKDKYPHMTYQAYNHKYPLNFTALDDGQCFFAARGLACYMFGDLNMVPVAVMESFTAKMARQQEVVDGVSNQDISKFIQHMKDNREHRVRLACDVFKAKRLFDSLNSASDLAKYEMKDGIYVVGAKDAGGLGHCFVLQVSGSERKVFDDFKEACSRIRLRSSVSRFVSRVLTSEERVSPSVASG